MSKSQILPCNTSLAEIKAYRPKGIILSGGPSSVNERHAPTVPKKLFDLGVPFLSICDGMQLVTHVLEGEVAKATHREYAGAELLINDTSDLFETYRARSRTVWMSHGDSDRADAEGLPRHRPYDHFPVAAMKCIGQRPVDLLPPV